MKLTLLTYGVLFLLSLPLAAQQPPKTSLLETKKDAPTEVLADETEWNRKANKVVARGNASIKQGNSILKAPEITGYFLEKDGQRRLDHMVSKGGSHLTHDDKILVSQDITAHFSEDNGERKLSKAVAMGKVHITTATQIAKGDKATYNPKQDTAILEGNVVLIQDQNRMKGDWAKANFITGNNIIRADKAKGGQVHGLLFPHSQKGK